MEKLIYLIWGERGSDPDAIRNQLLEDCLPRLLEHDLGGVSLYVDDSDSEVPTPMPWPADEAPLLAEVAFWIDCYTTPTASRCRENRCAKRVPARPWRVRR